MARGRSRVVRAEDRLGPEGEGALLGKLLDASHYDVLVSYEDAIVFKPDGTPLLIYRKDALPLELCRTAFSCLEDAAKPSFNRGYAAGEVGDPCEVDGRDGAISGHRLRPVKKSTGELSNTSYAKPVLSGIVGFFDRNARFPFCRTTAYNINTPGKFDAARPLFGAVGKVFRREVPERWRAQMNRVRKTHPDFVIHGTPFTTVTVNKNWRTAAHYDQGDFRGGYGCMAVIEEHMPGWDSYQGGYLVFPRYRVAVDMRMGGVCLADVHSLHGNTALQGFPNTYTRLSLVLYYREKMHECGSAVEEQRRAQRRYGSKARHDA